MAVDPKDSQSVLRGLKAENIRASAIGWVTLRRNGVKMVENGKKEPLPLFESDELTRVLGSRPLQFRPAQKRIDPTQGIEGLK